MATYRTIAAGETDQESPLTQQLMDALKDNPSAIAEGANGAPQIFGAKLASGSGTNVATLDIVLTSYTHYKSKAIFFNLLRPATNGDALRARTSTNGGSSYDSGASDYNSSGDGGTATSYITLFGAISNSSNYAGAQSLIILPNTVLGTYQMIDNRLIVSDYNGGGTVVPNTLQRYGVRNAAADVDAIRLYFSTGNISAYDYSVIGIP